MKRLFLLIFLFFSVCSYSQENNFVILSDINYSGKKSVSRVDSIITSINNSLNLDFVLVGGNLTSDGTSEKINEIYAKLQDLKTPFYVIPGPNDYKWSDNGGITINEIWEENRFSFSSNKTKIIGLNTSVINGSSIGHFFPEDLNWLNEQLTNSVENEIILILYHKFDNIDNRSDLLKILPEDKNLIVLSNQFEKKSNKKVTPIVSHNKFNFNNKKLKWQYSFVSQDSTQLKITEVTADSSISKTDEISMSMISGKSKIDSSEFVLYSAESVWGRNVSETMIAEPLIADNKVIAATYSGIITCFDSSGAVLWDYDTFGNITSKPAVINNILIVGTLQGDLITLNLENGSQLQSIGFDESITSDINTFEYTGKRDLMTVSDESVKYAAVFGTSSGKIYCYLVETLEEIWVNQNAKAVVINKPLLNRNRMFFSAWDGRIYCIDSREGVLIWKYRTSKNWKDSPANCFPVTDNRYLYYVSPDSKVLKLDLRLGSKIWMKNKYNASSTIGISKDKKKLFVKSTNGRFHILSAANGNWVREIIPRFGKDFSSSTIYERDKIITFASQTGDVYRINHKYYYKKLLGIGPGESHSVQPFIENSWIVSNKDGKIVRFTIK